MDAVPPGGSVVQWLEALVLKSGAWDGAGGESLIHPPRRGCVTLKKLVVLSNPVSSSA